MKIKSVTIENVHGVDNKTYNFGDVQYITGPNASGKSTILQSIQLALLGYIPGTGKKISDVFKHASKRNMSVTLTLDDDGTTVVVERTWVEMRTSITSNVTVTPDSYNIDEIVSKLELPIFNFEELLQLTANKLKDYFTDLLASGTDTDIDWHDRLKDFDTDIMKVDPSYIDNMIEPLKKSGIKGIESVKILNTQLKAELSAEKANQDRNLKTIQNLVYHKDFKPSYTTEEEYTKSINNMRGMIQLVDSYNYAMTQRQNLQDQLDAFGAPPEEPKFHSFAEYPKYQEYVVSQESIQKEIDEIGNNTNSLVIKEAQLKGAKVPYEEVIKGEGICPFTKKSCESVLTLIDEYKQKIIDLDKDIKETQKAISAERTKVDTLHQEYAEIENKKTAFSNKVAERWRLVDSYKVLQNQLASINVPNVQEDMLKHDWNAEMNDLTEEYATFKANKEYDRIVQKLNAEKSTIEIKIQFLKDWIDLTSVNKLQAELSNNAFIVFADYVNSLSSRMFTDGSRFKFYLENKANTFTFGLERDGKFIPYDLLSNGEKCMLSLALLTCVVKKIDSPLKLIMIDDMLDHLDDVNIISLMNVAKSEPEVQYIFAGVKDVRADDKLLVFNP